MESRRLRLQPTLITDPDTRELFRMLSHDAFIYARGAALLSKKGRGAEAVRWSIRSADLDRHLCQMWRALMEAGLIEHHYLWTDEDPYWRPATLADYAAP